MQRIRRNIISWPVAASLLLMPMTALLGGCEAVAAVASKVKPLPKQPAAFELQGMKTAVRVEADESKMGSAAAAFDVDPVAVSVRRALQAYAKVPVALSPTGAERVIVVELQASEEEMVIASPFAPSSAAARVRVLSGEGVELWPRDGSEGRYVFAAIPTATAGDAPEIRRQALRLLGDEVAKLFYEHVIEE